MKTFILGLLGLSLLFAMCYGLGWILKISQISISSNMQIFLNGDGLIILVAGILAFFGLLIASLFKN